MASSVDRSRGEVAEPGSFRRSQSRVYFESDNISSPTSWQFRGLGDSSSCTTTATTPASIPVVLSHMRLSLLRVSGESERETTGLSGSRSKGEILSADGSRNSTGSSTGSHRSQDSGFSDSGETRGPRKNCHNNNNSSGSSHNSCSSPPHAQPSSPHSQFTTTTTTTTSTSDHKNDSQRRLGNINQSPSFATTNKNAELLDLPTTIDQSLTTTNSQFQQQQQQHHPRHYYLQHHQQQYFPSPSSQQQQYQQEERGVNHHHLQNYQDETDLYPVYTQLYTRPATHSPSHCQFHEHNENDTMGQQCTNCLYQEVILARSVPGSPLSPLPPSAVAAACASAVDHHHQSNCIVELGAPNCASTPKRILLPQKNSNLNLRPHVMDKIDNFESLNKNKKSLDNNNNNSESGGKNFVSLYDTVSGNKNGEHGGVNTSVLSSSSSSSLKKRGPSSHHSSSPTSPTSLSSPSKNKASSPSPLLYGSSGAYRLSGRDGQSFRSTIDDSSYATTAQVHRNQDNHIRDRGGDDWNSSNSVVNKSSIYASPPSYLSNNNNNSSPNPKWQSLPRGFKRIPAPNKTSQEVIVKSHFDNDALRLWIHELRFQAEPECLSTLQTKAIEQQPIQKFSSAASPSRETFSDSPSSSSSTSAPLNVTTLAIHSVSAPLLSIRNVEQMACVISGEFSNICKHLEFGFFAQIPYLVESLAELLGEFLKHFREESFGNLKKLENRLGTSCYELRLASRTLNDLILSSSGIQQQQQQHQNYGRNESVYGSVIGHDHEEQFHAVVREIVDRIADLGHLFSRVVDQRLTRDLNSILSTIESGGLPGRVALRTYATVLQDGGMHICRLAASIRTVRGLLGVLLDSKDDHNKILALRCLATVLCVREALKSFDEAGGFEIIADILYDPMYDSAIKFEAVACLTQATDPWIDLETTLVNLGYHLEKIIISLTNLIPHSKTNEDTFLLCIAAISNLTFLEISSLQILRKYRTISLILNAVRENPNFSIFILDHVATVLANCAGSEFCRKNIVNSGGIAALICFLQQRPLPLGSAAEITACERLQQKSTIAISRLCNEEGVAKLVIEMNGMQRMIQLCRQEKERHYSDGVLIACLATLRKLATFCGDKIVQGLHAEDLIEPKLLESFLLYSSRQESYV